MEDNLVLAGVIGSTVGAAGFLFGWIGLNNLALGALLGGGLLVGMGVGTKYLLER